MSEVTRLAVQPRRNIFRRRRVWLELAILLIFNLMLFAARLYIENAALQNAEAAALTKAATVAEIELELVNGTVSGIDLIQQLAAQRMHAVEDNDVAAAKILEEQLRMAAQSRRFDILQVAIIDAQGLTAWSSIDPNNRAWLGDRRHFLIHREGLREPYVSDPLIGRVSGRWSLQFSRALLDKSGQFAGVVVVSVDPMSLSKLLAVPELGPNDVSVLYRTGDGRVLAPSRDVAVALTDRREVLPRVGAISGPARDSFIGKGRYRMGERVFGYQKLQGWPLGVMVSLDLQDMLAPVHEFNIKIRFVLLYVSLTSGALFLWNMTARRSRAERERLRAAEAALRIANAGRQELDRLLHDVNTVIYTEELDTAGQTATGFISPNVQRVLGLDCADIKAIQHLIIPADAPELERMQAELARTGSAWAEYRVRRPDGRVLWLNDRARIVDGPVGQGQEIVGTLTDTTEWHSILDQTTAANRLVLLGQMTASLAHELSQPVATIAMTSENALDDLRQSAAGHARIIQKLERILRQAVRARDIIFHLRRFVGKEAGEQVALSINSLVSDCLVLSSSSIQAADIAVSQDIPSDLPLVLGRQSLVEQVILNIITNAVDAFEGRDPENRCLRIRARVLDTLDRVEVRIQDNAGGIPEEVVPKIFEYFFTTKNAGKGTGLGLPLSREYMHTMGGTLEARNVDGGTEFSLTLPIDNADSRKRSNS